MTARMTKSWWWAGVLVVTAMALLLSWLSTNQAAAEKAGVRPVVPGIDDFMTVRTMTVRLPAGTGWTKRLVPLPHEGTLYEFERDLPNGNRLQIHIANYFGTAATRDYEKAATGQSDAQRLQGLIQGVEAVSGPDIRRTEWVKIVRGPQRRYGAVCRERHDLREEKVGGKLCLWQDWMLFCVDPVCRIPIQIDYAERYPTGGAPSPSFANDASRFYDSIEFRETGK